MSPQRKSIVRLRLFALSRLIDVFEQKALAELTVVTNSHTKSTKQIFGDFADKNFEFITADLAIFVGIRCIDDLLGISHIEIRAILAIHEGEDLVSFDESTLVFVKNGHQLSGQGFDSTE
ncbi:hypothetical protein Ciccas_011242 [Cichlidogyrus casuarinus]|uniref:Uncharacterized protein n=1 Tax=Cichlidogyrus casuarinus TaxID=1844966 RepID=A0ABD2PUQ4_9PLAT